MQVEKEAIKAERGSTQVLKRLMHSSKQKNKRQGYVSAFILYSLL